LWYLKIDTISIDFILRFAVYQKYLKIDTLLKKELIDKENERYFIPDRTFELWGEGL
jgi:hypothetical protein